MKKIPAILLMLNEARLKETVSSLDLNKIEPVAVVFNGADNKSLQLGAQKIPAFSFNSIDTLLKRGANCLWLLGGLPSTNISDVWLTAKFLIDEGIPRDNIINCIIAPHLSRSWIANLRYVERNPVDFFVTGISYTEVGLDLNQISAGKGINLSCSNQDLHQGYRIAKHVFEHQQAVKFVLIGLTPYSFRYDNQKAFAVCTRNLQYLLTLNLAPQSEHDKRLMQILSPNVKRYCDAVTDADADPNFERLKRAVNRDITPTLLANWEHELDNLTKKFWVDTVEHNLDTLEDYIKLCIEHGAKPIGVVLPFAPIIRRHYPQDLLLHFRQTLRRYDFDVIDLFDLELDYKCFYNMSHLNFKGARQASDLINVGLVEKKIIAPSDMLRADYAKLHDLSSKLDRDRFNALTDKIFESAVQKLRRKDKLKLGFVLYDASMWCGDELYQLFAQSDRYAPTVFLCLRRDQADEPTVIKDFHHGVEQFKAKGINVVAVEENETALERQDVLIFLTPYLDVLPQAFRLKNLTAETLSAYIPYGMHTSSNKGICNLPIVLSAWKTFFDTEDTVKFYQTNCRTRAPRGYCSGYPKMDYFFADNQSKYEWKTAQSNATKIIWAPHWSINDGVKYSTFHWNYKFFYDYAKAHSETAWVVKPHPNLLFSAVKEKLFPSAEAFEEYLNRWNELPNAKVETGAYYYDIFASSDGMIHDSGSFTLEYQYTHKPMLFLRRDSQHFGEFALELMEKTYCADGKDHDKIAKFIEQILIAKRDPKEQARREFFDKYLNYRRFNGMPASEYIFNAIDKPLRCD